MLTQSIFFDIYRGAAFNILPHDNYVPYLLYILGEDGGSIAHHPIIYRLFSILIAVPFFYILPFYRFYNLENISDTYLMALEALSFTSYLAIFIASIYIYKITTQRFYTNKTTGIIALFSTYIIFRHTGIYSIDPIAIMFITIMIYYIENIYIYSFLLLLSVGFNEKISMIFFMLIGTRFLLGRQKFDFRAIITIVSVCIYFGVVYLVGASGNEHQLEPSTYTSGLIDNVKLSFSFKGFFLNVLPVWFLMLLYIFATKESRNSKIENIYFMPSDGIVIAGLLTITLFVNVEYNIGRIVMYSFPFYLPLASLYFERLLEDNKGT
jgi:hypothetical protein